jgi:hypothetical protein
MFRSLVSSAMMLGSLSNQWTRPNFTKLFETMRDGILDRTYLNGLEGSMRTTVGVYFCGPSGAGKSRSYAFHGVEMKFINIQCSARHQEGCKGRDGPRSPVPILEGALLKGLGACLEEEFREPAWYRAYSLGRAALWRLFVCA